MLSRWRQREKSGGNRDDCVSLRIYIYLGCRFVGFSLLTNPFAVLGLSGAATIAIVTAQSRKIGGQDASAASRILISPRTRLPCELAFLPGATTAQIDAVSAALRDGRLPDIRALTPLAGANVLAHLVSAFRASPDQMRELVAIYDSAPWSVTEVLDRDRAAAQMPPVSREALAPALEELRARHADALSEGARARPDGSNFLVQLLRAAGPEIRPRLAFLRQASAAWERGCIGGIAATLEAAEPIEAKLRECVEAGYASNLASSIAVYAELVGPPREAARLLGLPHEASAATGERWLKLALDMSDRQTALADAMTLLQALAAGFGAEGELERKVASALEDCRKRLASGEGSPEMQRLIQALQAAHAATIVFQNLNTETDRLPHGTPALIVELHVAFVAATEQARSDQPWQMLRGLCLRLHNEFSATNAALSFTMLALSQGRRNAVGTAMLPRLETDRRFLHAVLLRRQLNEAAAKKVPGVTRRILAKLVTLTDDAAERAECEAALAQLRARGPWRGLGALAAGITIIWILGHLPSGGGRNVTSIASPASDPQTRAQWSPDSSPPVPTPIDAAPAASVPIPAYDLTEQQPAPETAVLSLAEYRWCLFRKARADAAKASIEAMRASYDSLERFNAAIDAYNAYIQPLNASCSQYQYRKSDDAIVVEELRWNAGALHSDGTRLIREAYLSVPRSPTYAIPNQPSLNDTSVSVTASPVSTAPAVSQAYLDGQADRRTWESWFADQGGDFRYGADWWAGIRSTSRSPTCAAVPPRADREAVVAGCKEARSRLAAVDRRRRTEPNYRAGWNHP